MPTNDNISEVVSKIIDKLNDDLKQLITLQVATGMLAVVKDRIHDTGKASDGNDIGTYNNTYLKERMKYYNRTSDKKIILSLTSQMENDFSVQATGEGYGLGFNNPKNMDKAKWNDNRFGHTVYALTKEEEQKANEIAKKAFYNAIAK
jgi:hypothetical protein